MLAFVFRLLAPWSQDGCHSSRHHILIAVFKDKKEKNKEKSSPLSSCSIYQGWGKIPQETSLVLLIINGSVGTYLLPPWQGRLRAQISGIFSLYHGRCVVLGENVSAAENACLPVWLTHPPSRYEHLC